MALILKIIQTVWHVAAGLAMTWQCDPAEALLPRPPSWLGYPVRSDKMREYGCGDNRKQRITKHNKEYTTKNKVSQHSY